MALKRVEHTFFEWLAEREKGLGRDTITATLVKTGKNQPLSRVFEEMSFRITDGSEKSVALQLDLHEPIARNDVVELTIDEDVGTAGRGNAGRH